MIIHLTFTKERLNFCILSLRKVKIGQIVLKKRLRMWKFYTNDNNDDDRQQIDFDLAWGSGELKILTRW